MSINKNPTKWEDDDSTKIRISFLNCRSMKNKFENIRADKSLLISDIIILMETWVEDNQDTERYDLPDLKPNFNNGGRGKGIAAYSNEIFTHIKNIRKEGFCISMVTSENIDVVGVYRSQEGDLRQLTKILETLIDDTKTVVIGGDLNICALKNPNNVVTKTLKDRGFEQVVKIETHIEGGLLGKLKCFQSTTVIMMESD